MLQKKFSFAACALALAITANARAASLETPLERATKAFEAGQYKAVVEAASTVAATDADAPRVQYLAGEAELVLGDAAAAETAFRAVLKARPKAVPAQVGLARALTVLTKYDEARPLLDAALTADPKDTSALTARGLLLARMGKHDEGLKDLKAAYAADAKSSLTVRAMVEFLVDIEDFAEAARISDEFVKARPEHPMGDFLRALVYEKENKDTDAIARYQKALEKDPAFLDAHKNLAILCHTLSNTYKDKERTKLAYEHYKTYFELGGSDPTLKSMYEMLLQYKDQIMGS